MTKTKKISNLKARNKLLKGRVDTLSKRISGATPLDKSIDSITSNKLKLKQPSSYYKYMKEDVLLHLLKNKTIKITNPLKFNDPMDCTFPEIQIDENHIKKLVHTSLGNEMLPLLNDFKSESDQRINYELTKLKKELKKISAELSNNWAELISGYRVLSLTAKKDNLLMWSHYADEHRGVVVQFKSNPSFGLPRKVDYYNGSKILNVFFKEICSVIAEKEKGEGFSDAHSDIASDYTLKIMFEYFFMKMTEWEYENEHRVVYRKDNIIIKTLEDDLDVISIGDDDIERVILGSSITLSHAQELKSLIKETLPNTDVQHYQREGWSLKCKSI
ncbi:MAG: DUF2971 domain-containing protein [Pantoea dispersa]